MAAGVTPLEQTILSGDFPIARVPLVLGSEGGSRGGREQNGFPAGSRVMFTGPYGVFEDGAYSEWLAVPGTIVSLLRSGAINPIVAKTFPLTDAADALRYLVEGRPF